MAATMHRDTAREKVVNTRTLKAHDSLWKLILGSTQSRFSSWGLLKRIAFGNAYVFHPYDMVNPAQVHLKQDGLCAEQAVALDDFFVLHVVLPI